MAMMVGGLQNLGFMPPAGKTAERGSTSAKEDKSFNDVLSQTKKDGGESSESTKEDVAPVKAEAQKASVKSPAKSPVDKTSSAHEDNLPSDPVGPTFEKPIVAERVVPMAPSQPLGKIIDPTNKVGSDDAVNALTKRVVWNDFLRKMKNDLGVTAEDVLNAFSSLSAEDLAKPPEQSVDKVVMALGLDGQQAMLAKQYFSELIQKTKPQSLGQELARSEKDITLTLMSQREIERRSNQKSVDRMQQQFFMTGAYKRPDEVAATAAPIAAAASGSSASSSVPMAAPTAPMAEEATLSPNMMAPVSANATAKPNSIPFETEDFQPVAEEKPSADVDSLIKKFMSAQASPAKAQAVVPDVVAPVAAPTTHAAAMTTQTPAMPAAATTALQNIFGQDSDSSKDDGDYSADASYLGSTAGLEHLNKSQGPGEFQSQLNAVQGPQPMAVPDLVQQARVMVHDGGGEMKVTLRPDGLGEVAMRVSVNEGKVNVQMITESDEAKKLIERQLGDLKTSLTTHHLQVDSIKVDTATNLGKQLEQQYHDAQRQMAQQTLEQFRQDQQGWRRSFFEVPSARIYKDQTEAPRDIQAPTASSKRTGHRRLDLVA